MKSLPSASKLIVVLLSLHVLMPVVHAWAPVSALSVTTAVATMVPTPTDLSEDWALTKGNNPNPAPSALKSFSETVVNQLSKEQVFTSWSRSKLQYFPLGPGTHSWLVTVSTVSTEQKELGYLIFTAKDIDSEEYILSEYGTSPSVPYHLDSLQQTLTQLENNSSSSGNRVPTHIEPLYSPLLPLWKVTFAQEEPLYINALTMEILPWDEAHWKTLNLQTTELNGVHFSSKDTAYTSLQAVSREGQRDPYDNLMWITSPKLSALSDQEFETYINNHNSLVFTSPNRNDEYGGPFAVSGFQKWNSNQDTSQQTVYAAIGLSGHRYVPLSILRNKGEFHAFPTVAQ